MNECPRRVLFLTGAPLPSSLSWTDTDLSAPLQSCFFALEDPNLLGMFTLDNRAPSWRSLLLKPSHLPTGLTQASREDGPVVPNGGPAEEASFLKTNDLPYMSSEPDEEQIRSPQDPVSGNSEILSQYYEHSFAVHEDIPSSQIVGAGSFVEVSFSTDPEGYSMTSTTNSDISSQEQVVRSRLAAAYLSDLRDMPNAAHLRSIIPQTMTVNLVVGIISISQPRTIITRRGGRSVDLVEILVGDYTRSGFGINIWLPSSKESHHLIQEEGNLRSDILHLRPQDIVLARTIALSSFNGKVYGQSLRRNMTRLDLLYRNVIDADDERGTYRAKDLEEEAIADPQVSKVKRVKEWVMQFIGNNAGPLALNNGLMPRMKRERLQVLPSDTP